MPDTAPEDWLLVSEFLENEASRQRLTQEQLAKAAGLNRTTLHRLGRGEALGAASLARLEGALNLPRDFLTYIAQRNDIAIATASTDSDMTRWLVQKIGESAQRVSNGD